MLIDVFQFLSILLWEDPELLLEAFGEILMIDNEEYLFFRELEPSIYYYIDEKD